MTKELLKEFGVINRRLMDLERRLADFSQMLNERQQGDIDYLAMELDVDLEQPEDTPEEVI